jgi:DNA polymerase-3 subunit epsilon
LAHFPIYSWLEDPGFSLDPQIIRLTGLQDKDLAGKKIDDEAVARLLDRSDLIVAHNAAFDAAWIEQRWPQLAGRAWACSCVEIDWLSLGLDGRGQQYLLQQHGWFSRAHRAAGDVWSLFWLLLQSRPEREGQGALVPIGADDGTVLFTPTHLQRLLAASVRPSIKIEAIGVPFSKKALLAQRGYRWDPGLKRRYWWRELNPRDVEAEQVWFSRHGFPEPRCVPISAHERHR